MGKLAVELGLGNEQVRKSLKRWLLEKAQAWINAALEAEMSEHLQRGRYEPLSQDQGNYRNGHRPRRLNLCGLGPARLKVPRDRQGTFKRGNHLTLVIPEIRVRTKLPGYVYLMQRASTPTLASNNHTYTGPWLAAGFCVC